MGYWDNCTLCVSPSLPPSLPLSRSRSLSISLSGPKVKRQQCNDPFPIIAHHTPVNAFTSERQRENKKMFNKMEHIQYYCLQKQEILYSFD